MTLEVKALAILFDVHLLISNTKARCSFNLSAVSIPKSLSSIGKDAFRGSRIEKIYVEKGDAERIKELLRGKGIDLDKVEFVEQDDESAVSFVENPANGQAK